MADVDLQAWIGRSEDTLDVAEPGPLERLAALLDHETPPWRAGEAPPLAHWLYFLPHARQSEIAKDGHPFKGGFLPPTPLPRRMFGGSRLTFHAPLAVGAPIKRTATVAGISDKTGSSGAMIVVTVRNEIFSDGALSVVEEQDAIYREAAKPGEAPSAPAALAAPTQPQWSRSLTADPVQLFRYSALTFNGHRIHYDRPYAMNEEGYPGLVVHGPFTATLLVDHYLRRHPGAQIKGFSFRARRPLFDTAPFEICGVERDGGAELWTAGPDGAPTMTASLEA